MSTRYPILAVAAVLVSGCVASQTARFRPARASGVGGRGYPAAQQPIQIAGQNTGQVSVWSPGVYPPRQGDRPVVHVALQITNQGRAPMQLDMEATDLGIVTGDRALPVARPYHVAGNTTIAPGQAQRVDLYYALPEGVSPRRVDAFIQGWAVQTSNGSFRQYTPFARYRQRRTASYFSLYYHWPHWRHHYHHYHYGYYGHRRHRRHR